jgi:hypothetical protein
MSNSAPDLVREVLELCISEGKSMCQKEVLTEEMEAGEATLYSEEAPKYGLYSTSNTKNMS